MNERPDPIVIIGQPNTMALIVRSIIEEHGERAPLPASLAIGLDVDGQLVSIFSADGKIRVAARSLEGARAVFDCSLEDFVEAVTTRKLVSTFLAGKLGFRGSPIEALKAWLWLRKLCAALR